MVLPPILLLKTDTSVAAMTGSRDLLEDLAGARGLCLGRGGVASRAGYLKERDDPLFHYGSGGR